MKITLTIYYGRQQVFSGKLEEVPGFFKQEQPADQVKLYGADGAAVVTMKYRDFINLVGQKRAHPKNDD